jgi:BirA family biotin operon repressor/biotin-[acetyl-CoA-carboxylase] ligase
MKPENIYTLSDFTIYEYLKLDSTNKVANDLLLNQQIHDKHIILAISQTNGVGKNQRIWQSATGNLCCSVIIQITDDFCSNYTQLSLLTAVALGQTLHQIQPSLPINYKWPNDLLLNCQKVAGILIDSKQVRQGYQAFIIGIGVNLKHHPTMLNLTATNLQNYNINLSCYEFLQYFLPKFNILLQNWQTFGFIFIKKLWLMFAYKLHQTITINITGKTYSGIFIDINQEGNIVLQNQENHHSLIIASCDW